MIRLLRLAIVFTGSALLAGSIFAAAPAYAAYPTSSFYGDYYKDGFVWGKTSGTFTWYNQSVGVQGQVCDYGYPEGTTVKFGFWDANYKEVGSPQTRYVDGACRSFNFTQDGPYGGIRYVTVHVCWGDSCQESGQWARKY